MPPVTEGACIGAPDKPGHDDGERRGAKHLFLRVALPYKIAALRDAHRRSVVFSGPSGAL